MIAKARMPSSAGLYANPPGRDSPTVSRRVARSSNIPSLVRAGDYRAAFALPSTPTRRARMGKQIAIVDYLVIDDGEPHLAAWESVDSGALYFDRRNADAKSGGTEFRRRRLANTGTLRSF